MKLRPHGKGYWAAAFRLDGRYVYFLVQRLVLETFIGPCPEGMEALHWDGNKKNNNLSNLRWGTREENVEDSIRHGTFYKATEAAAIVNRQREYGPKSEEHKAKLSESQKRHHRLRRLPTVERT